MTRPGRAGKPCYTELNPVRSRLVVRGADWPWSSAPVHCGLAPANARLAMDMWRSRWSDEEWRAYLETPPEESNIKAIRDSTFGGRPLGSPGFTRALALRFGVSRVAHTSPPHRSAIRTKYAARSAATMRSERTPSSSILLQALVSKISTGRFPIIGHPRRHGDGPGKVRGALRLRIARYSSQTGWANSISCSNRICPKDSRACAAVGSAIQEATGRRNS